MSKATDKSRRKSAVTLRLSIKQIMLLWTETRAVSVEWNLRYATWEVRSKKFKTGELSIDFYQQVQEFRNKSKFEIGR